MKHEKVVFVVLCWVTLLAQYVAIVSGNRCTAVLSRNEIHEVVKQSPCIQKYEARCGWLSLNYCTFYKQTTCDKKVNETIKTYFIKTDCCSGFVQARNGSCIKKTPGLDLVKLLPPPPTEDPDFVAGSIDKKKTLESDKPLISGGGYAGIICGGVLLVTIIWFIVIAVKKRVGQNTLESDKPRISGGGYAGIICGGVLFVSIIWFIVIAVKKRRRKKHQKSRPPQTVLYVPSPTSPMANSNSTHSQLSVLRRETTSLSSHTRTPPGSPVRVAEVSVPVEQGSSGFIPKSSNTELGASPTDTVNTPLVITVRDTVTTNKTNNQTDETINKVLNDTANTITSEPTNSNETKNKTTNEIGNESMNETTSSENTGSPVPPGEDRSSRLSVDIDDICEEKLESLSLNTSMEQIPLMSQCGGGDNETTQPSTSRASPSEGGNKDVVEPKPGLEACSPDLEATVSDSEAHVDETAEDTPLVFKIENLNDDTLPESDI